MGLLCSCHGSRGSLWIGETSVPLFFYAYNATCTDILSFSPLDAREIGVKGARRLASFMSRRLSREMPHSVQLDRWEVTLPPLGRIKRRRSRVFRPRVPKVSTPILFSALIARYLRLPRPNTYLSYDVKLILRVRDNYTRRTRGHFHFCSCFRLVRHCWDSIEF